MYGTQVSELRQVSESHMFAYRVLDMLNGLENKTLRMPTLFCLPKTHIYFYIFIVL